MKKIVIGTSHSLKEFRLLPQLTTTEHRIDKISLETRLCKSASGFIKLSLPYISAAMQAVSDATMAIKLAQQGGMAVLPLFSEQQQQINELRKVKQYKAGFQTNIVCLSPNESIEELNRLIQETGFSVFPVTDKGLFYGKLLGIITSKDFNIQVDSKELVRTKMRVDQIYGKDSFNLDQANALMIKQGRGFLPIINKKGQLTAVVFKKDLDHHSHYPFANVDKQKRLMVGAAVSTHPHDRARIDQLVKEQVDFLLIDASDGFTFFQQQTIKYIKKHHSVPVIAGNVVTAQGFDFLADAGADAIKIGMGIGSGCITQNTKATGRGQATALLEISAQRNKRVQKTNDYIPLIADGGMSSSGEIAIALAIGADCVMLGNVFARCTESPGRLTIKNGKEMKEYWMEGSLRARNLGRYFLGKSSEKHNNNHYFEEGISGWVPHSGSIQNQLNTMRSQLCSTLSSCGSKNLTQLQKNSQIELQSNSALIDANVHHISR